MKSLLLRWCAPGVAACAVLALGCAGNGGARERESSAAGAGGARPSQIIPASGAGGVGGLAGTSGAGGMLADAGSSGMAVPPAGAGGAAGLAGMAGEAAAGASAGAGAGGTGGAPVVDPCAAEGATAHFSFFVTSLAGMRRLSGSENGFGGDLRFNQPDGLSGADEICRQLAEAAYPGAGCKSWRAFLSVTKGPDGQPVNASDRVGDGPWYDRLGRLVAMNKADLLQAWPTGADPTIMHDLPNEDGVPNHNPDGTGFVDNHTTLTGTLAGGALFSTDPAMTCRDWTSSVGTDGTPAIGFSWMGGAAAFPGNGWYYFAGFGAGCAPFVNLTDSMDPTNRGVGAFGGYGGFYCLALEP